MTRESGSAGDWDGAPTKGTGLIGKNIRIKGVVRGKEDLVVEGEVDGSITLPEHHLTLEKPSRTTAELKARNATIRGRHRGNAEAIDKIEIASEAVMIGDLRAPRLVIREGAKFRGTIDMEVALPPGLEAGEKKAHERSDSEGDGQGQGRKRKNRSSTSSD